MRGFSGEWATNHVEPPALTEPTDQKCGRDGLADGDFDGAEGRGTDDVEAGGQTDVGSAVGRH